MSSASGPGKLNVSAIIIGLVVDLGSSTIGGLVLFALLGVDPGDPAAVAQLVEWPPYLLASLPLGLVFTSLGGFTTAHIARGEELNNAFVMGVASAIAALVFSLATPGLPLWYLLMAALLTVPAAVAGGYVRLKTRG